MDETTQDIFRETQWLVRAHWWLAALIAVAPIVGWWALVQQVILHRPFGNHPGPDWVVWLMWAVCGLAMPVLLFAARMTIRVTGNGLRVTYFPLLARTLPFSAIKSCEPVEYHPLRDFGGWGIHSSARFGLAYTVGGNQGVELELADGKRMMLGSQRSMELASTLRAYLRRA